MNEKMMEIPRIGSFDKEYGRKNGKLMLPQPLWTDTGQESVDTAPFNDNTETDVTIVGGEDVPMPVHPVRPIPFQ